MEEKGKLRRREPITDTQLLMTITICIFVGMYILAILIWGGGFKKPQMLFDMLNDNAYLIIISCGLTIVMITGSIDISVGGVTALVAMVGVMILNGNLGLFNGLIASLSAPPYFSCQSVISVARATTAGGTAIAHTAPSNDSSTKLSDSSPYLWTPSLKTLPQIR